MEVLTVRNLTFTYPNCTSPALQGIDLHIEKGSFNVVCGATGSGKTTLLRLLKRELAPVGTLTGEILIDGAPRDALDDLTAACSIGYVMQRPEQQLVTDRVWHELAFGPENQNLPQPVIARRVAEMASYFGIESWYEKPVSELSGGQKQLLNLAAVMVMQPSLLILDEPTAQLDPIAASNFLSTIARLNRELGLTILIIEHRLEEVIPLCDRMLILDKGKLLHEGSPREVIARLGSHPLLPAMPAAARLWHAVQPLTAPLCLDVREGRSLLVSHFGNRIRSLPASPAVRSGRPALSFDEVWLRYERTSHDILRGLSFTVHEQEIYCLLGGNGAGKSTTLSTAAGLIRPYSGTIRVFGKKLRDYKNGALYRENVSLLPQDVQTVFMKNTVREELTGCEAGEEALPVDLRPLYDRHPYDLSGGEQQLVALAKVLSSRPRLLLLDEPTKGLDAAAKLGFQSILRILRDRGMTIILVTHDLEFAAGCADRCALFFRGQVISEGEGSSFFTSNSFYTTAASRMTRGHYDGAATVEQAAALCLANRKEGKQ